MLDYKIALGYISVSLVIIGFLSYGVDVLRGKTKPHAFSWLIWAILTAIGFSAQLVAGGGAGAWSNGASGLMCAIIFILASVKGQRKFTRFDWALLALAASALVLWWLTGQEVTAIILIILADCIAFAITYKKTYYQPYSETLFIYSVASFYQLLSLFALETYAVATWLYPAVLFTTNTAFVTMVLLRRKQIPKQIPPSLRRHLL